MACAGMPALMLAWNVGPAVAAPAPSCVGETEEIPAAEALDSRSVSLADGRVLRVAGIESFALLTGDGDAAEAALADRLATLIQITPIHVRLLSEEPDRYGRLAALIAVGDGQTVQEVLLAEGLAIAFAADVSSPTCFTEMLAAEGDARRNGRGYWADVVVLAATPEALNPHLGRFVIFEGEPLSVGNRRATTYLNFGERWSEDVTVEIAAVDRDRFGGEAALADLAGKRVRIRGFLEDKAGPMVRLRSPAQIEEIVANNATAGEVP